MAQDNIKSIIESLLLVSEKPLTIEQAKFVLDNLSGVEIRKALEELKLEYEQSNRGMRIIEIAGGFQMITPPDLAPFLKKLFKERRAEKLSKPSLETLAIIAYKQPVSKLEIQTIRDVDANAVIKNLLDKNLVRVSGRKKAPGRPYVFGTTRQFLEYFGLQSLEDLPKIEELSSVMENKNAKISEDTNDSNNPA